jgi:hypothetical protein
MSAVAAATGRNKRGKAAAFALALALAAGGMSAASAAPAGIPCGAALEWHEDGTATRVRYRHPDSTFVMQRYRDALRIEHVGADGRTRTLIDLDGGPQLLSGTRDPQDMFMAGMPVMLPLYYLARRYASPCAVPASETFSLRIDDDRTMHTGPVQLTGSARRNGSRIDYEIHVMPLGPPAAGTIDASGTWESAPLVAIGEDTDVRGAAVVRAMRVVDGAAPSTVAEARAYAGP